MGILIMWEVVGAGAVAETRGVVCGSLLGAVLTAEGKYHLVGQSQIYRPDGLNVAKIVVVLNAMIRKVTCLSMKDCPL